MPPIRIATADDIDALLAIEGRAFATDRLSRRSLRRLIASPSAAVVVLENEGQAAGYALILFRTGSNIARLYSIAVGPGHARNGFGRILLTAAEEAAVARGRAAMRLEVHEANKLAIRLYEAAGYHAFGRVEHYYADGAAAIRYERSLASPPTL
jgi:ribosomal protein S18 acetylase RimI-like enzyme